MRETEDYSKPLEKLKSIELFDEELKRMLSEATKALEHLQIGFDIEFNDWVNTEKEIKEELSHDINSLSPFYSPAKSFLKSTEKIISYNSVAIKTLADTLARTLEKADEISKRKVVIKERPVWGQPLEDKQRDVIKSLFRDSFLKINSDIDDGLLNNFTLKIRKQDLRKRFCDTPEKELLFDGLWREIVEEKKESFDEEVEVSGTTEET